MAMCRPMRIRTQGPVARGVRFKLSLPAGSRPSHRARDVGGRGSVSGVYSKPLLAGRAMAGTAGRVVGEQGRVEHTVGSMSLSVASRMALGD